MKKILLIIILFQFTFAQRQNLSGLKFCIDPGHGGNNPANDRHVIPDPGTDFWESESNFQKALLLKPLLESRGAWVILTRATNYFPNDEEPSLSARSEIANQNNVNWFHSIHSNATGGNNTSTNYTLILVKENIATRQAAFPEALLMSDKIYNQIRAKLQTGPFGVKLDYTFYGGASGGFNLGVLKNLIMPGQLSEGSFHDFFPETRRLMNNDYRKLESYGIYNGFLQYYGVPFDTTGKICGIQTDTDSKALINFSKVKLLPENKIYSGDKFNNGFYFFDSLFDGSKKIIFETPNFKKDSVEFTLTKGETKFINYSTPSLIPPTITYHLPKQNDTMVSVTSQIGFIFSISMDTNSVKNAFSVSPNISGRFVVSNNQKTFVFKNDAPLPYNQNFQIIIDSTAKSISGIFVDANKDGIAGDNFVLNFKTQPISNIKSYNYLPQKFSLLQNYPNPFNSKTIINYDVSENGFVSIKIFDLMGREIETIVNNFHQIGNYAINYNASKLKSGIYFYRLESSKFHQIRSFHLLK